MYNIIMKRKSYTVIFLRERKMEKLSCVYYSRRYYKTAFSVNYTHRHKLTKETIFKGWEEKILIFFFLSESPLVLCIVPAASPSNFEGKVTRDEKGCTLREKKTKEDRRWLSYSYKCGKTLGSCVYTADTHLSP